MPLSHYEAIRSATERIYGDARYYDISAFSHSCLWMIGGDNALWLSYDIDDQQTKYRYLIND